MRNEMVLIKAARVGVLAALAFAATGLSGVLTASAAEAEAEAPIIQEVTRCSDSDNGSDLSVAGTVTSGTIASPIYYRDQCSYDSITGSYSLKEYSCKTIGSKNLLVTQSWILDAVKGCRNGAAEIRNVDVAVAGEGQVVAKAVRGVPPFSSDHRSLSLYQPVSNSGLHQSGLLSASVTVVIRGPNPALEGVVETLTASVPFQAVGESLDAGSGRTLQIPLQDSIDSAWVDAIYEDALSSTGLYSITTSVIVHSRQAPESKPLDNSMIQKDSSTLNGNLISGS